MTMNNLDLRVNTWAKMVHGLNDLINDKYSMSILSDNIKKGLESHKTFLYSIYQNNWSGVNIGYPNTIDVVGTWGPVTIEVNNPMLVLFNIDLMIRSIAVDLYAVELAQLNSEQTNLDPTLQK